MQEQAVLPGPGEDGRQRLPALYRMMVRIRAFEEAAAAAQQAGHVTGAVHLSIGQEAVAAGVCAHLRPTDLLSSTHRGHGHTLAKGADPAAMMAELFGRATGICGGKGGSMHIADFKVGMLGANGVVAAGIPIIIGAAQGLRLRGSSAIAAGFFGDGAVNRGPFLEGLNWAAVFRLPVLFVCEDNGWAATTRTRSLTAGPGIAARAEALGVPAVTVDGNDVEVVAREAGRLCGLIRGGAGPQLLCCETYRLLGHTATDKAAYRDAAEVEAQWRRDPLVLARTRLQAAGVAPGALDAIEAAEKAAIAAAVAAALAAPWPTADQAFADVQDVGAENWPS